MIIFTFVAVHYELVDDYLKWTSLINIDMNIKMNIKMNKIATGDDHFYQLWCSLNLNFTMNTIAILKAH